MSIKMQEFRNQIEIMKAQQEEFIKKIQSLERELLNMKNNLNSVLQDSELKKQAMDRYNLRYNLSKISFNLLSPTVNINIVLYILLILRKNLNWLNKMWKALNYTKSN